MYPFNKDGNFDIDSIEHTLATKLTGNNLPFTVDVVKDKIVLVLEKIGKVFIAGDRVSVILLDYDYLNLRLLIEGLFKGRMATDQEWTDACL